MYCVEGRNRAYRICLISLIVDSRSIIGKKIVCALLHIYKINSLDGKGVVWGGGEDCRTLTKDEFE
jgi:hypothetical protein